MICHQCGNPLLQAVTKKPVEGVEKVLPTGQSVRVHKCCAAGWDAVYKPITAQPSIRGREKK